MNKMKKIITLTLFVFFNSILFAEIKPKLSLSVFANETACWTCLQSIKTISNTKLEHYQLEIKFYFCSENKELLDKLLEKYELNVKTILDPECLYGKKYDFSLLPAIVIKDDEKDSIVIKEHWNNPQEYLNKIIEYDKNYTPIIKTDGILKYFTSPIIIKEADGTPMNIRYSEIVYHPKLKKYYCLLREEEDKISILDSNGLLLEEIDLKDYNEVEEFFSQGRSSFMNDSVFIWRSTSKIHYGQKTIYALNINTKKIIKSGLIDTSYTTTNSCVHEFVAVSKTNKLVFAKYFFRNNTINKDEKLLLMTDTNYIPVKYFGKVDTICETTTMAGHYMTFPIYPAVYDSNIYYLMSLSNQLYVFDLEGNYVKTIELQFEKNYNPPLINIAERTTQDEHNEIYEKYKHLFTLLVQKDRVIVIAGSVSHNKETLKREVTYYITIFDKEGNILCNTFELPPRIRVRPQINGDLLLVTETTSEGSLMIRWLNISDIIKEKQN